MYLVQPINVLLTNHVYTTSLKINDKLKAQLDTPPIVPTAPDLRIGLIHRFNISNDTIYLFSFAFPFIHMVRLLVLYHNDIGLLYLIMISLTLIFVKILSQNCQDYLAEYLQFPNKRTQKEKGINLASYESRKIKGKMSSMIKDPYRNRSIDSRILDDIEK